MVDETDRRLQSALSSHQEGELDAAERHYRALLDSHPGHADALHLLGVLCHQTGRDDEAARLIGQALEQQPDNADFHCNLATVYKSMDQADDAIRSYSTALELAPEFAEAHNNLGGLYHQTYRYRQAIHHYQTAIALHGQHPELYCNLAAAFCDIGQLDDAEKMARHALELSPQNGLVQATLGRIYDAREKTEQAIAAYRIALELEPNHPDVMFNLAVALDRSGAWSRAIDVYQQVLQINPSHAQTLSNLVYLKRRLASWQGLDVLSQRLRQALASGVQGLSTFALLAESVSSGEQLACARLEAARVKQRISGSETRFEHTARMPDRIRIGYVSSGFHDHPTSYLVADLFERHDRDQFMIFAYGTGPDDGSDQRHRIRNAVDEFVDMRSLSIDQMTQRIHEDQIDILVDLRGYGAGAVSEVFAMRPAPVQINYLAFPCTMGADFIDYIIADEFVAPAGCETNYSEQIIRLPNSYQPNDSTRQIPDAPSRNKCGLPDTGFVFCSFNNSYKITPEIFLRWCAILDKTPGSVLWLLDTNPDSGLAIHLKQAATVNGVAEDRLIFMTRQPHAEYLARYQHAGLFLDTLPYNAHTTATDALWAGCPVLTCPGKTFASRVAGSLLTTLGMDELIAASLDEYVDLAVLLAGDPDRLAGIRKKLAAARSSSPLFDMQRFARDIEKAYSSVIERFNAGEPAKGFSVN